MIRVKILRTTNAGHQGTFAVGQLVQMADRDAHWFIARGRAVAVLDLPDGGAPTAESADPVAEHHDPSPARARRTR